MQKRLTTEKLILFVVSTTGQGDVPENMQAFWRFLRRADIPATALSGLQFSMFGLGDSGYPEPNINRAARMLHSRLMALGARLFHPTGFGDDQHELRCVVSVFRFKIVAATMAR